MEDLALNHHSIRSLDEIVDYLVPPTDLLRHFRNGKLCEWLYDIGEDDKSNKVRDLQGKNLDDAQALVQLIDALGLGDNAKVMYSIGKMYLNRYLDKNGAKAESDAKAAVSFFRKAADVGSVDAMFKLGECYDEGWGVDGNIEEVVKWYEKAARLGCPDAQYELALCYLYEDECDDTDETKYSKLAVGWLKEAAAKDHADAMRQLGECYYDGEGTDENMIEAEKLFERASDLGGAEIQLKIAKFYAGSLEGDKALVFFRKYENGADENLQDIFTLREVQRKIGNCYKYGWGVDVDPYKAVDWYRKAALHNDAEALSELADCYYWGNGEVEDEEEAARLWRKAAEKGYAEAQRKLGRCYLYGRGIDVNAEVGVKWLRKAAENGDADAQCELGKCYRDTMGVKRDKEKAICLFEKAVEQEYGDAYLELGKCYLNGDGKPKDEKKAFDMFRKAADRWDTSVEALRELGNYFFYGTETVPEERVTAVELYKKAAEKGDVKAQYNLARCLFNGWGLDNKDFAAAKDWAERAAKSNDEDVAKDAQALLRKIPAP